MGCNMPRISFDWEMPDTCCEPIASWMETLLVSIGGECIRGYNSIGWTDPRRLDEYGEHLIYKNGEVVGSFFIDEPLFYALAE